VLSAASRIGIGAHLLVKFANGRIEECFRDHRSGCCLEWDLLLLCLQEGLAVPLHVSSLINALTHRTQHTAHNIARTSAHTHTLALEHPPLSGSLFSVV